MHASIEQLLSFRDQEPVADHVRLHIGRCEACRSRLARLEAVGEALRALPESVPAPEQWSRLCGALARSGRSSRPTARPWLAGGMGLAASASIIVFLLFALPQAGKVPAPEAVPGLSESDSSTLVSLLTESQRTEQFLRLLPGPRAVVRAGTAATIEELQQHIALVDYQLSHSDELGLTTLESRRLWQQRVDLLNSLAQLRYVEAQSVSF